MAKSVLFMRFKAKAGKREEVRHVWEKHLRPNIENNAAFEGYLYCWDDGDPDSICVFQLTSDAKASEEFVKAAWYKAYHDEVTPLLVNDGEFTAATPVWTKARNV